MPVVSRCTLHWFSHSHLFTLRCWPTSSDPTDNILPISLSLLFTLTRADGDLPAASQRTIYCRPFAVIYSYSYADLPVASHCTVYCRAPTVIYPHSKAVLPVATLCTIYYLSFGIICSHTGMMGVYSLRRRRLTGIGIPMTNLRRFDDRLRFTMGIPILVSRRLLSE